MPLQPPSRTLSSWPQDAKGRLISTTALVAAERGYAATRVSDVLDRTGISRRTFYAHFANLEDCFFAAYDAIVADLAALLETQPEDSAGSDLEPPLRRTLSHYATRSAHARVLLIEILCAGPAGVTRHEQTMAMLALRLSDCVTWQPGTCASLPRADVAQAALGAMLRMVQLRLLDHGGAALPLLLPSLVALTTRVELVLGEPDV